MGTDRKASCSEQFSLAHSTQTKLLPAIMISSHSTSVALLSLRQGLTQCWGPCARRLTFRADKAPADVDVLMVAAAPPCSEVIGADDTVGGEDHRASSKAEVIGMVRDRTSHTAHQATCHRNTSECWWIPEKNESPLPLSPFSIGIWAENN